MEGLWICHVGEFYWLILPSKGVADSAIPMTYLAAITLENRLFLLNVTKPNALPRFC